MFFFTTRVFYSIFIQVLGIPAYFLVIQIKYSLIYSPYMAAQSLQLLSDPNLILITAVCGPALLTIMVLIYII